MRRWLHWSLLMSISVRGNWQISLSKASNKANLWQDLGWEPNTEAQLWWRPVPKDGLCIYNLPGGQLGWEMPPPTWHSSSVAHVSQECHSDGWDNWQVVLSGPSPASDDDFLCDLELTAEQSLSCKVKWPRSERRPQLWTLWLFQREGRVTVTHVGVSMFLLYFNFLLCNHRVKYLKKYILKIKNNTGTQKGQSSGW